MNGNLEEIIALLRYAGHRLDTYNYRDEIVEFYFRQLRVKLLNLTEEFDRTRMLNDCSKPGETK